MTAIPAIRPHISVEEYLEGEQTSDVRHEYLGGDVYAMAGATDTHNIIAGNIFAALHRQLRQGPCQAFISDMKVKLKAAEDILFYYPDIIVACDPKDSAALYRERPNTIIEVLSPSTDRVDRREKLFAYHTIPQLENYVLVEQEKVGCTVFRRSNVWASELLTSGGQNLVLANLNFTVSLHDIYEGTGLLLK
jgi:Uma2 family endonuclease